MAKQQTAPLGKGLSELLSSTDPDTIEHGGMKAGYIPAVSVHDIEKNPYQPRVSVIDGLDELVNSIKEHGLISPLIVTILPGGKYRLIAGERRLSAAREAGLTTVPVIVKEAAGGKLLEMAIIENIQRKDLNPIEEGNAYKQLQNEFGLNVLAMAKKLGIEDLTISRRLALVTLPEFAQIALIAEQISMHHAELLLPLLDEPESMRVALNLTIKNQLSTKQLKGIVEKLSMGLSLNRPKPVLDDKSKEIEISITKLVGRKITFSRGQKGGKIVIPFNTDQDLDDIYKRLSYIGYHI